jgi:putative DNA primase/helicase
MNIEVKNQQINTVLDNKEFTILGNYDGRIYAYINRTGDFISFGSSEIPKGEIRRLAPLSWWSSFLGDADTKTVQNIVECAAELILRASEIRGIFNDKKIRGCGAWIDDGKPIFHLGTKILTGDTYVSVKDFRSNFVYPIRHDLSLTFESPLKRNESIKLIKLCEMLSWEDSKIGMLFAGWLFTAPLCGAMLWRSHIYLLGAAGSGKSYVTNTLIPKVLGDIPLNVQGSSTEAGIRQLLDNDARPIIFDESEPNDPVSRARLQSIISLARQASTPEGAPIVKGTAGQSGANSYYVRSCFALSSIDLPIKEEADKQRFTILRLKPFETDNLAKFKAILSFSEFLTPSYAAGLLARGLKMLPIIRENQRIFMDNGEAVFGNRRVSDQMSMMLAGVYALTHDEAITPQYAIEWLESHEWNEQKEIAAASHSEDLLNHIMDSARDYTLDDHNRVSRTIRELIATAYGMYNTSSKLSIQDSNNILRRNGFRLIEDTIAIANQSEFIKLAIKDTHWNYPCTETLLRLKGAIKTSVRFDNNSAGVKRAVTIPLSLVLEIPKKQEILNEMWAE